MSAPRAASTALILAALIGLLAGCGGASSGGSPVAVVGGAQAAENNGIPAPPPQLGSVVDIPVPADIAHLPLTTAAGTRTDLAAYAGKPVMIADFLTLCTDICPMISANTAAMARDLVADGDAGKVALLEISVDPRRDTPARLRAYQNLFGGPLPGWTLLRASPADTAKLWGYFHVWYHRAKEDKPPSIDWLTHKPLTYDVDHSDNLIFLDAAGHERFVVDSGPNVGRHLPPAKLVQFLDGQGVRDLYHPDKVETWTVGQGMQVLSWLTGRRLAVPS